MWEWVLLSRAASSEFGLSFFEAVYATFCETFATFFIPKCLLALSYLNQMRTMLIVSQILRCANCCVNFFSAFHAKKNLRSWNLVPKKNLSESLTHVASANKVARVANSWRVGNFSYEFMFAKNYEKSFQNFPSPKAATRKSKESSLLSIFLSRSKMTSLSLKNLHCGVNEIFSYIFTNFLFCYNCVNEFQINRKNFLQGHLDNKFIRCIWS